MPANGFDDGFDDGLGEVDDTLSTPADITPEEVLPNSLLTTMSLRDAFSRAARYTDTTEIDEYSQELQRGKYWYYSTQYKLVTLCMSHCCPLCGL